MLGIFKFFFSINSNKRGLDQYAKNKLKTQPSCNRSCKVLANY